MNNNDNSKDETKIIEIIEFDSVNDILNNPNRFLNKIDNCNKPIDEIMKYWGLLKYEDIPKGVKILIDNAKYSGQLPIVYKAVRKSIKALYSIAVLNLIILAIGPFFAFYTLGPFMQAWDTDSIHGYFFGGAIFWLGFIFGFLLILYLCGFGMYLSSGMILRISSIIRASNASQYHVIIPNLFIIIIMILTIFLSIPSFKSGYFKANWPQWNLPEGWVELKGEELQIRRELLSTSGELRRSAHGTDENPILDVRRRLMSETLSERYSVVGGKTRYLTGDEWIQMRKNMGEEVNKLGFEYTGNKIGKMYIDVSSNLKEVEAAVKINFILENGDKAYVYQFIKEGYEYEISFYYTSTGDELEDFKEREEIMQSIKEW